MDKAERLELIERRNAELRREIAERRERRFARGEIDLPVARSRPDDLIFKTHENAEPKPQTVTLSSNPLLDFVADEVGTMIGRVQRELSEKIAKLEAELKIVRAMAAGEVRELRGKGGNAA